ncbi:hypothetical protein Tco_0938997 [Tanacetum coccineum]|uniref:Uncharacterized protein n=1 Tax=Tanacetum coccineum TaxID=301880 RepID=A0ABQ5DJE8_9ASTR
MYGTIPTPIPTNSGNTGNNNKGPLETRDTKIAALRLKFNAFKALEGENLPKKWLSMNQTKRANNSIKNDSLTTLFCKYNYEEELINQIYEFETKRFTIQSFTSKAFISNTYTHDNDSDVEEDTRSSSEFLAYLNVEFHDRALLANQKRFYKRSGRNKSDTGLVLESFDWVEESLSSKDEGVTRVKEFMTIAEDEPAVGKNDAISDYTKVDLYYVEDQMKNLLNKFNSLKQELSSCKYELIDLKYTKVQNLTLQHEIARLNVDNESLQDKVSDLKKETISSKDVVFTKGENSASETSLNVTSDTESVSDNQQPLPPSPKLLGAELIGTSKDVISSADLTQTSTYLVEKAFKVFNIRRQEMEETFHVTFNEADEVITQTSTKGDDNNFNENKSFPDDEFLVPIKTPTQCKGDDDSLPYVPSFDPLSTKNITIPDIVTSTTHNINPFDKSPNLSVADDHHVHNEPGDFEPYKIMSMISL